MKALNVPVVRVKSYLKDEIIDSGSGIMIAPQYVLTATHVLCGDRHTVIVNGEEKDAVVEKKNHIAVLLAVETESKGKADAEKSLRFQGFRGGGQAPAKKFQRI